MFENLIKQKVSVVLNRVGVTRQFYNGTLFVSTITEGEAQAVLDSLGTALGADKVQMSPIGDTGEYAYDFI